MSLIGNDDTESSEMISEEEEQREFTLNDRFSAQDLHYNNLLKELQIKKVYEKITDDCFDKVRRANENIKRDYTEYRVPFTYMGAKDFNFTECLVHVIFTLRKAGFYVRFFAPNKLFICWPDYEKLEKEQRKMKFLEYEHKKSTAILQTDGTVRPKAKEVHKQLQSNPYSNNNDGNDLLSMNPQKSHFLALPEK